MTGIAEDSLEKLLHFRREIDRIFSSLFAAGSLKGGDDALPIDIDVFETDEAIIMEAELPGVDRHDIDLSIIGDVIIIEGVRRPAAPGGPVEFLRMERHHGRFRRMLEIPGAGNTSRVQAGFENGVLRLRVPRINERRGRRRRIEIE